MRGSVEHDERIHNAAFDEKLQEQESAAALVDLVERIMRGERYQRIGLYNILRECDQSLLAEAICAHLRLSRYDLEEEITGIVRAYLYGTKWHDSMISQRKDDFMPERCF